MERYTKEEKVAMRLMGIGLNCKECQHWHSVEAALMGTCDILNRLTFEEVGCYRVTGVRDVLRLHWKVD